MSENDDTYNLDRRSTLQALGVGAGAVAGIGAFSGTAVAWDRFDVCFRDCSEVWMIVTEDDIDLGGTNDPAAVADVIVASGGSTDCRTVEFTSENATSMPDRYGESPVVTYSAGDGEKIIGVLEYNYTPDPEDRFDDPVSCVHANQHDCATMNGVPELHSAPCVPDNHPICTGGENCCPPCESGEDLLVKYEWEGGEFVTEGSDDNIELDSVTLDEEGEPMEVCFTTSYCQVDPVVKAGQGYETYENEAGSFCVTGITSENPNGKEITKAISNIQFFCEAPADPSVGNSGNGGGGSQSGGGPP